MAKPEGKSTRERELQRLHPTLFGRGAPGMQDGGIGRQVVRQIVTRAPKGEVSDARGRPPALPQACLLMIMAAFTSVVSVRATLVSAPMLQPIAIAIIISAGHGGLLHEGRKRRGLFVCSVRFIRELIKERGWKNVRPCGDTRKVPDNYVTLRWLMVLRLAYFVLVHSIPHELCLNGDHTGIMFTLAKGKMWITKAVRYDDQVRIVALCVRARRRSPPSVCPSGVRLSGSDTSLSE